MKLSVSKILGWFGWICKIILDGLKFCKIEFMASIWIINVKLDRFGIELEDTIIAHSDPHILPDRE
jgi:hypothetical protein